MSVSTGGAVGAHSDIEDVLDDDLADELRQRTAEPASKADAEDLFGAFSGEFFRELATRKREGRDAKCLVTAKDGQTGVGKTNACDFLAYVADTTSAGFAEAKTTIDPFEFLDFYNHLPPGSATIMEEGEQFDARRSNSNKNVDAAEKWQMARVREIVAFVNLPSPAEIDSRFERLADYWINIERRGFARVYKKRIHPTKRQLYYETLQTFEWPNMDDSATFQHMDALKDDRLDDGGEASWVRESEVRERVEKARKEAREAERDAWITSVYKHPAMSGSDVASLPACDVGRSRVSQIASRGEQ
jgi:hypothetical protein